MTKQSFLKGTFILMIAGMITKILGFVNKMVVARIIGEEGIGLYMMAYPTLILTVTLTQLGLPVAISKLVAEADALNDQKKIKKILTVSFATVGFLSLVFTTLMVVAAPLLAKTIFTDPRTIYPLIAIAPIVPIVAVASVLRGYFQGLQNMKPFAFSQVIEQIVRISLVASLTTALLPYGIEYAAGGTMISGVIGEFVSLLYMISMFKRNKGVKVRKNFWGFFQNGKETFKQLMKIALPTTGSRLIGSISYFLEPIIISHSLYLAGVSTIVATKQYGELEGFAIPLLTLPSFITFALQTSLVPTISEAQATHNIEAIHYRLNQAMKIAMITGGISIVVSYVFAEPLMTLMYHSPGSAAYVYIMGPFFFLFYFQGPLQAVLQALDLANAAMINSFIGAAVKLLTIFALASRPELGIIGAALGFVVSVVLVTLLHLATVIKRVGFSLVLIDYIKGIFAIIVTGGFAKFLMKHVLLDWALLPRTAMLITATVIFYVIVIRLIRLLKKEELSSFPIIGKWVA
ncbi:stage V sporulation protein B [Scopulibacillus daqui]|uniref:Stage V sporulation protein B n=1 Tax=Scopulibacillus daqui TaxID=1469162 RepID=A0ABS2PXD3_9BACL|nr:stage V sporulation protein B [Scopulibacillus daqui]MBM7644694.1 stage V sporulation protein B [Scopulibacillus daqui]